MATGNCKVRTGQIPATLQGDQLPLCVTKSKRRIRAGHNHGQRWGTQPDSWSPVRLRGKEAKRERGRWASRRRRNKVRMEGQGRSPCVGMRPSQNCHRSQRCQILRSSHHGSLTGCHTDRVSLWIPIISHVLSSLGPFHYSLLPSAP